MTPQRALAIQIGSLSTSYAARRSSPWAPAMSPGLANIILAALRRATISTDRPLSAGTDGGDEKAATYACG